MKYLLIVLLLATTAMGQTVAPKWYGNAPQEPSTIPIYAMVQRLDTVRIANVDSSQEFVYLGCGVDNDPVFQIVFNEYNRITGWQLNYITAVMFNRVWYTEAATLRQARLDYALNMSRRDSVIVRKARLK